MKRAVIIAKGDVQRVGYRDLVEKTARKLKLTGFVENLKPYDVRIVAEGEEYLLNEFVTQTRIEKHPIVPVSVEEIEVEFGTATGEFEYFGIKRGDPQEELGERMDVAGALLYTFIELGRKLDEDIGTMRREFVGEVGAQISTLRQERLLLFEEKMLSDMYEHSEHYDSKLQKTIERHPHKKSVFIMMPFEKNDIRLKKITDTIKKTLEEHGLCGWRADDPDRSIMDRKMAVR